MMEVCRRNDYSTSSTAAHHQPAQQAPSLVANFVPSSNGNVTFTINNQLTNQVQRLVRDRSGYDGLVSSLINIFLWCVLQFGCYCSIRFTMDDQ